MYKINDLFSKMNFSLASHMLHMCFIWVILQWADRECFVEILCTGKEGVLLEQFDSAVKDAYGCGY